MAKQFSCNCETCGHKFYSPADETGTTPQDLECPECESFCVNFEPLRSKPLTGGTPYIEGVWQGRATIRLPEGYGNRALLIGRGLSIRTGKTTAWEDEHGVAPHVLANMEAARTDWKRATGLAF